MFSIAESAFGERAEQRRASWSWPLLQPRRPVEGVGARDLAGRRSDYADLPGEGDAEGSAGADALRRERRRAAGRRRRPGRGAAAAALCSTRTASRPCGCSITRPASVALKPVTVARYETDRVIIGDGLAKGDIVVTAGVNPLRESQKVRLARPARWRQSDDQLQPFRLGARATRASSSI